jgi:hypothetical protein
MSSLEEKAEALDKAISFAFWFLRSKNYEKPGAIISSLNLQALKELTSNDLKSMRFNKSEMEAFEDRNMGTLSDKEVRQLKKEFDRRLV